VRRPLGPAPDRPSVRHDRWNRDVGLHGCTRLRRSAGAACTDRNRDRWHDCQRCGRRVRVRPDRWRSTALAAYATGYPVGATIGGALTALAIPRYGWRSAFAIGGAMSLVLLLVAWRRLPESVDSW